MLQQKEKSCPARNQTTIIYDRQENIIPLPLINADISQLVKISLVIVPS
jgi:predicted transcriptional regulator YheO